jgi:hypothetical protein
VSRFVSGRRIAPDDLRTAVVPLTDSQATEVSQKSSERRIGPLDGYIVDEAPATLRAGILAGLAGLVNDEAEAERLADEAEAEQFAATHTASYDRAVLHAAWADELADEFEDMTDDIYEQDTDDDE